MAVQSWMKMSISPIFGLMPHDSFYTDFTFQMKRFLPSQLHIPIRYEDTWNFPEVKLFWFELQFDHRFCCFWAILLIFKCDYLDN